MPAKVTFQSFLSKAKACHSDKYIYNEKDFVDNYTPMTIACREHGEFSQKPRYHNRPGIEACPKCALIKAANTRKRPIKTLDFIKQSCAKFQDKFIYNFNSEFFKVGTIIPLTCRKHDCDFSVRHDWHLDSTLGGCPLCIIEHDRLKRRNEFIKTASLKYQNFDYSSIDYIDIHTPIEIKCETHGQITIKPKDHLRVGCYLCKLRKQDAWLFEISTIAGYIDRQHRIRKNCGKLVIVDGYHKSTNTVFLFHGTFWHGHPDYHNSVDINPRSGKSFGLLYEETLNYEASLSNLGYNVISIWEHEWENKLKNVRYVNGNWEIESISII